ncbi:hypothetical protein N7534_004988 [Penicillium rubens]|nr:hypothetical protein N7534_004988 [Penicillium rubens]
MTVSGPKRELWFAIGPGTRVLTRSHIRSLAKESNNYRSSLNKTAAIDPKSGKSSLRCVNATQSQQNLEDVVKAASMSMVSLLVKGLHKTQPELHHLKKEGRL